MITEDIVPEHIARLLYKKGFDEPCLFWYSSVHNLVRPSTMEGLYKTNSTFKEREKYYKEGCYPVSAPTLQMAMKWLRDEKNIHIKVHCSGNRNYLVYAQSLVTAFHDFCIESATCSFNSYEEACEAAIKYCLENLVQSK